MISQVYDYTVVSHGKALCNQCLTNIVLFLHHFAKSETLTTVVALETVVDLHYE
jgi:hypothetical protein